LEAKRAENNKIKRKKEKGEVSSLVFVAISVLVVE
jgi:hypothetical protein